MRRQSCHRRSLTCSTLQRCVSSLCVQCILSILYYIHCILFSVYYTPTTLTILLWNMISTSRKKNMIHTPTKPYNSHPTAFCVGLKVLYFRMVLQFQTSQKYPKSFKERPWVIRTLFKCSFIHVFIYLYAYKMTNPLPKVVSPIFVTDNKGS